MIVTFMVGMLAIMICVIAMSTVRFTEYFRLFPRVALTGNSG
jgi:hypothetical protein